MEESREKVKEEDLGKVEVSISKLRIHSFNKLSTYNMPGKIQDISVNKRQRSKICRAKFSVQRYRKEIKVINN